MITQGHREDKGKGKRHRSFCILDEGFIVLGQETVHGYWVEDDDTGEEGLLTDLDEFIVSEMEDGENEGGGVVGSQQVLGQDGVSSGGGSC